MRNLSKRKNRVSQSGTLNVPDWIPFLKRKSEKMFETIAAKAVNTIRTLSIDAVEAANSGHPGLPMGAAPMENTDLLSSMLFLFLTLYRKVQGIITR